MKKRAFTLIEIIITFSLIILISTISLNCFALIKKTTNYEVERFISDINHIKSLSLQGDNTAKIELSHYGYTISYNNLSYYIGFSDSIQISDMTVKTIEFSSTLWTKGTTINMDIDKKRYILTISAITGRVKLEKFRR